MTSNRSVSRVSSTCLRNPTGSIGSTVNETKTTSAGTSRRSDIDDCIELALVYNRELFAEARAQAMLEQWIYLLNQIVEEPARRLDRFSMVPPAAKAILPNPAERLDDRWQGSIHSWRTQPAA